MTLGQDVNFERKIWKAHFHLLAYFKIGWLYLKLNYMHQDPVPWHHCVIKNNSKNIKVYEYLRPAFLSTRKISLERVTLISVTRQSLSFSMKNVCETSVGDFAPWKKRGRESSWSVPRVPTVSIMVLQSELCMWEREIWTSISVMVIIESFCYTSGTPYHKLLWEWSPPREALGLDDARVSSLSDYVAMLAPPVSERMSDNLTCISTKEDSYSLHTLYLE